MAGTDTFIQLPTDGTGKMVRSWSNVINTNTVHAQAFVMTDVDGNVLSLINGLKVSMGAILQTVTGSSVTIGALVIASTDVSAAGSLSLQFNYTSTANVTVAFEGSNDNTNWDQVEMNYHDSSSAPPSGSDQMVGPGPPRIFSCNVYFRYFRVRITNSAVTGTFNATLLLLAQTVGVTHGIAAAQGNGFGGYDFWSTGGRYNATLPTLSDTARAILQTNSRGMLLSQLHDGANAIPTKALPTGAEGSAALPVFVNAIELLTYDVAARNIATGALTANTAKAVLSIEHSAASTKTVRLRRVMIHAIQTTALSGLFDVQITRGTAASTAGTAATPVPRKVGDAAVEAVVKSLPTIVAATVQDNIPAGGFGATTALYSPPILVYDFQEGGESKPLVLRAGVLESIVFNIVSTAAHNLTLTISVDFTEE